MYTLLKVIVGSHAHGLAGPESDTDYRGVYALPTSDILSLGFKYKGAQWLEGETEDNTAWEIGHFLSLALQNNPTILEVFKSPTVQVGIESASRTEPNFRSTLGLKIRELFPIIINPKRAFDAFMGYGKNQQRKFLEKKDNRPHKYAVAHIRTLLNLIELLETGTFSVDMSKHPYFDMLKAIKNKDYTVGDVINTTEHLTRVAEMKLENCKIDTVDDDSRMFLLNKFLLQVREEFWS